jgi:hypothetical protein
MTQQTTRHNVKQYVGVGLVVATLLGSSLLLALTPTGGQAQQVRSRLFPETNKTVKGRFLEYWEQNGALPQQGYPISEEIREVSPTDGKTYTVQYFERAVFEAHPENPRPFDVLLSLLGNFLYRQKYPQPAGAPGQRPNTTAGSQLFPQTGKRLGGVFLAYWRANGGLAQQGYPISDEFTEVSQTDGKSYTVQYFERAVFEYHPEQREPRFQVLLSLLGVFRYKQVYEVPTPQPTVPVPTPVPTGSVFVVPSPQPSPGVR